MPYFLTFLGAAIIACVVIAIVRLFDDIENCDGVKMSRANCVKEFSEIPKEKLELLYDHRFAAEKDVPFDEYVKRFGTVEADGIFYYRESEKRKVADWVRGTSFGLRISDAVIIGDSIVKNRFGLK